jgi:lysophospholipase L1-like esterase
MIDKPQALTLVYMGDSITEGQYVGTELRWTDVISDRLHRKFLQSSVNLMLLNQGISGETTRQGLERYARSVQVHQPEVMTLQFGLNDCNCWVTDRGLPRVSLAAYRENLIEMIDRARAFEVREIILSTNHPTLRRKVLLSGESLEDSRRRYNDAVRKVADEKKVILCDIEAAFAGVSDDELDALLLPYPDHLHLSAKGHLKYAGAIQPYIEASIDRVLLEKKP